MRHRLAFLACMLFGCVAASAGPVELLPRGDPIHLVNLMSDDDGFGNVDGRGTIEERREALGITPAEELQIRRSSGYVFCEGAEGKPITASGALVESNRQIVSAAHTFLDAEGRSRGRCSFQNHDRPPQIVEIDLSSARYGKEGPRTVEDLNDWAVVDLKEPVIGATPFALHPYVYYLEQGTSVLGVAASQTSPARVLPEGEPIVQGCRVRDIYVEPEAPVAYITDCDLSPRGSGGPILVRGAPTGFFIVGIFVAAGKAKLDGQPYDVMKGSYTRVAATDGEFWIAIMESVTERSKD